MFTIGGVPLKDAKKQAGSFWSYLYPKKEDLDWIKNSAGEIITGANIDSLMPKLDDSSAGNILGKLQKQQKLVDAGASSWQKYFGNLQDGQKWQIDFVQNTDLQKASLDDVKVAQDKGRQAAIAHNAALKQQTLGAKAATFGLKALALVGNTLLSMGITWLVSEIVKGIDNWIHAEEKAAEAAKEAAEKSKEKVEQLKSEQDQIDSLMEEYKKLASAEYIDETSRERIRDIQKEINNLVGGETEGLDLVNGKLDEQLKKHRQINAEKANLIAKNMENCYLHFINFIKTIVNIQKNMYNN